MVKIKIEGQTINGDTAGITDEIANDDDLLKAALVSTWPDVRTATFTRTGGKDGKELVVTVTKKAGTKGMTEAEIAQQKMVDGIKQRKQREAERLRKLEDIAVAADAFLSVHWEFDGDPGSTGEHVNALGVAVERLGEDEIAKIREERRSE